MRNVKIYQLYFKDEQRQYLNPLFTPYDNTINLRPNDREYPLLKECYKLAIQERLDLWGAVSWNYKFKFSSSELISDRYFLDHIENNPDYDVYFFNPFTNHVPIVYNVWEQGQWCHPHIVMIMEHLLPLMNVEIDWLYQPQDHETIFFGSMAVGNKKFWDGYFQFAEKYRIAISKLPDHIRYFHDSPAAYRDTEINYFSFIQERLMSLYLLINKENFKILPFHINENTLTDELKNLNSLKSSAIRENNGDILQRWRHQRINEKNKIYSSNTIDWASSWLTKFNCKYSYSIIAHDIDDKKGFSNRGLLEYLNDNIKDDSSLLDLGCGPRLYSSAFKNKCNKILCIDAWENVKPDIVADLENTLLSHIVHETYDYIFLIDVIEHLNKEAGNRLLEECKTIVNKKIFLLTPLEEIWTSNHENVENKILWCYGNRYDLHKSVWYPEDFNEWTQIKLPGLDNCWVGYFEKRNS